PVGTGRAADLRSANVGRMTMSFRTPKLTIDPRVVAEARRLAAQAGRPIVEMARTHTTVSVERAVLRLARLAGPDAENMPLVNRVVDAVRQQTGLEQGVALPVWDAMIAGEFAGLAELAEATSAGQVAFRMPKGDDAKAARALARQALAGGFAK